MAQAKTATLAPRLDTELARRLVYQMALIRRFEEKAAEMYALGKIGGFLHLYIGQEAVAVGATSTHPPDDYAVVRRTATTATPRQGLRPQAGHGRAVRPDDGLCKGKGGSMHFFDKSVNFLGGYGIVGGHLPLAAGAAFASKYQGGDQVVLCFFGDGAVPEGEFHESLNLAALWKLPVDLHLREQPLRHGHRHPPRALARPRCRGSPSLRHARRGGGRHGRAGDAGLSRRGRSSARARTGRRR